MTRNHRLATWARQPAPVASFPRRTLLIVLLLLLLTAGKSGCAPVVDPCGTPAMAAPGADSCDTGPWSFTLHVDSRGMSLVSILYEISDAHGKTVHTKLIEDHGPGPWTAVLTAPAHSEAILSIHPQKNAVLSNHRGAACTISVRDKNGKPAGGHHDQAQTRTQMEPDHSEVCAWPY